MDKTEVLVVGSGPAGLKAALGAAEQGAEVTLVERDHFLGGQLVKQTHMFFGSKEQYASERGFKIAEKLTAVVEGHSGSREGEALPDVEVKKVSSAGSHNQTSILALVIPKDYVHDIPSIRVG